MRHMLYAALVAVVALGTVGCVDREAQKQAKRTEEALKDPTRPVKVQPASRQTLTETLEITGAVTTSEDVEVGAKVGGRLVSVYVRDGDPVKAGQTIAIQDTSDAMARIRQAQAQVSSSRSQLSQAMSNAAIQPSKTTSAVKSAEAELRRAKANYSKVKAGARQEEVKQAEAAVTAAESAMNLAKKELDRTSKLVEEGAIPRARLDQAQNAYQAAMSQYQTALQALSMQKQWARPEDLQMAMEQIKGAEEAVRQAKAQKKLDILLNDQVAAARANLEASMANLQLVRQTMSDAVIKAPFAGRISGKPVQAGAYLAPGSPVARIVGGAGTYFEGEVPEMMITEISTGRGVKVTLDALPGKTIYGSVAAVAPMGEDAGRLFKVRVQLGAGIEGIRPGMFARGIVDLRAIPDAIVVPANAIIESGKDNFVYVIQKDPKDQKDKAKRVPVKRGVRQGDLVQVMGLATGQQVVVEGQGQLAEGTVVKIEGNKVETVAKGEKG